MNSVSLIRQMAGPNGIIAIDIDIVLRAKNKAIAWLMESIHNVEVNDNDFDQWDPPLYKKCGMARQEFNKWAWGGEDVLLLSPPTAGAVEAIRELMRTHTVKLVTACQSPQDTKMWLRWWGFPNIEVVHTADKASVQWDVLIDDSPSNLGAAIKAGRKAIAYSFKWNEGWQGPRINGWGMA